MTDMGNVIEGLEQFIADFKPFCGNKTDWQRVDDALALLKEQEPVEPKMMEFVDKGVTWEKYEVSTCGVCGTLLGDALFCPQCGREVKWDD